jgi:copper homeostasis protein
MGPVLVEACVTSLAEARAAAVAGAHRLELCRALEVGGLTPGLELVEAVCRVVDVPVFTMVRPRDGRFRIRPGDVDTMVDSIDRLRGAGARGMVLGFLDERDRIDRGALDALVAAAAPLPVTFHRAFDRVARPEAAAVDLIQAGVVRILTAGGPGTAWEGRARLRRLVDAPGSGPVVLAGGGVRGDHVRALVAATGVREVHARAVAIPGIVRALTEGQG